MPFFSLACYSSLTLGLRQEELSVLVEYDADRSIWDI